MPGNSHITGDAASHYRGLLPGAITGGYYRGCSEPLPAYYRGLLPVITGDAARHYRLITGGYYRGLLPGAITGDAASHYRLITGAITGYYRGCSEPLPAYYRGVTRHYRGCSEPLRFFSGPQSHRVNTMLLPGRRNQGLSEISLLLLSNKIGSGSWSASLWPERTGPVVYRKP